MMAEMKNPIKALPGQEEKTFESSKKDQEMENSYEKI